MSSIALLRLQFLESFQALQYHLQEWKNALLNDPSPQGWVGALPHLQGLIQSEEPRQRVLSIISQLEYLPEQDPREILICPGIVPIHAETFAISEQLNAAKASFKQAVLALKKEKITFKDRTLMQEFNERFPHRHESVAEHLRRTGLSRLHLKACYRVLPLLTHAPKKISWTWANTKAIKKISLEEAKLRLLKRGDDLGIQLQLQKLNSLRAFDTLAIVQKIAPHLRANLVFHLTNGKDSRKMLKGTLPIFYLYDEKVPFPIISSVPEKHEKHGRHQRADQKLEKEIFLPAIRAHRYL